MLVINYGWFMVGHNGGSNIIYWVHNGGYIPINIIIVVSWVYIVVNNGGSYD